MQKFTVTFSSIILFSAFILFGQNLMTNGDLELWDDVNTPTSWNNAENITQESTTIHAGTYSAMHTATSSTRDFQQVVSGIASGTTYDIVYYYYDNDPNARTRIWSYWLSGTSTLSDNATELRSSTYSSDNASWQEYNQRLTAPTGADGFRFEVRVYNDGTGGGVVYYDDFSVTEVAGIDNPPSISNIEHTPKVPTADENTTVTAVIKDDSGLTLYQLKYAVNGGITVDVAMTNTLVDTFTADIPSSAYADGDLVKFWIYAEDDATLPQSSESDSTFFFAGTTPISTVKEVDANGALIRDGAYARLVGVSTVENGTFTTSNMDVHIQDATGGINLFMYGEASYTIPIGNEYTVVGVLDQYNGKGEIIPDDVADITDGGASTVPDVTIMTIDEFLADPEAYEGMLVQILDADYVSGTWPSSITLNDGGTYDLVMYIDSDTDIDESTEGDYPLDVTGIFSQYDNSSPFDGGYQILPRSVTDLNWGPSAVERMNNTALITEFKLHGNFPNPFNPSTTLQFDVPTQVDNLSLSIYNTAGQKIATLYNGGIAQGTYQYTWYGVNQANQVVPSGVYFAVLKAADFTQSIKMMLIK